jgi:hypothetical protein
MKMPNPVAYALGIADPRSGRLEFLCRGVFPRNLIRTPDPHSAWTWPSIAELKLWLSGLPQVARDQLLDRSLLIVPLTIAVGAPAQAITVQHVPPGSQASGDDHARPNFALVMEEAQRPPASKKPRRAGGVNPAR